MVTELKELMEKSTKAAEATEEGDGCHRQLSHALEVTREAMEATEEGHGAHEGHVKFNQC